MKSALKLTTVLILLAAVAAASVPAAGAEPELIPREALFGNQDKTFAGISADGTKICYFAPSSDGVLNLWVRTLGKEDDRQVTNDTYQGIRRYFWAKDGRHIIFVQDRGGNEVWHFYSVNLDTGVVRDLTPFQGIGAFGYARDARHPGQMLVGMNLRDRQDVDIYRIDLATGAVVLDTDLPDNTIDWFADPDFVIRAVMTMDPETGATTLRVRDSKDKPWRDLLVWPFGESGEVVDFTADGKAIHLKTSLGSDTTRLVRVDLADGRELMELARDRQADVGEVVVDPNSRKIQAVGFNYLKNSWTILDPTIRDDFAVLEKVQPGELYINDRDQTDRRWIVYYRTDDGPLAFYLYDRGTKKAEKLFVDRPELENYTLAQTEPLVIEARDGLRMTAYLTLPPGQEPKNLPLVLKVHAGPWRRDEWGLDPEVQWLANRGYAVLQVNFRGSTSFGKAFLNAGNFQLGVGSMQHDLTDAVKWAVKQGIADPKKICIYGSSYGGYAALAGLAFTPDLYACGVAISGPSNWKSVLEALPPFWSWVRRMYLRRVGDVVNDDELNRRISPLFHADKITKPLIIAQGANDPKCNIRESEQMVAALRGHGRKVTYLVYPDEGHDLDRPENRLDLYGRIEQFLARHLGGRAEPWREVEGSSAELR